MQRARRGGFPSVKCSIRGIWGIRIWPQTCTVGVLSGRGCKGLNYQVCEVLVCINRAIDTDKLVDVQGRGGGGSQQCALLEGNVTDLSVILFGMMPLSDGLVLVFDFVFASTRIHDASCLEAK